MHAVVETPIYLADAKAAGVTEDERTAIVNAIAADPEAGDIIPGTGGVRKVRVAGKGKGKSGGYRVITYVATPDIPVFLLALVSKGQRAGYQSGAAKRPPRHRSDSSGGLSPGYPGKAPQGLTPVTTEHIGRRGTS